MRDIREDLRQRLQSIALQRGELQARMEWLDKAEAHVRGLMEYEKYQVQTQQEPLFSQDQLPAEGERTAIAQFLREALADGRSRTLEELKKSAAVRDVNFEGKNPGRVLHFALLGMAQSGVVAMVNKGVWQINTERPVENDASQEIRDSPLRPM
ncbi:MAG: hypothetical protein LAP40_27575 [Acidobacteriia bacterium]|nr:hypothetical protein [Terriglobia bacterium]